MKLRPILSAAICAAAVTLLAASTHANTVWLSSLDLAKASQGYGAPQADKTVDSKPITLAGQVFDHGFGTHAPGLLAVNVNGATKFTASVGVDDEIANDIGSVEFQVLGDGRKILWRSGVRRKGQPPVKADVAIASQKQIVLRVTTGGDAFNYDHADWADAQFTFQGTAPKTAPITTTDPVISMDSAAGAPVIHPPFVLGTKPGAPLVWTIATTGRRPLSYSATGLPKGLSLNAATGTVTGSIAKASDYKVRVRASNAEGRDEQTIRIVAGKSLALTPPMGWNSYDCFGQSVTEAEVLANADYLAKEMQPFGWEYVVVDYRWYEPDAAKQPLNGHEGEALDMDAFGRLIPNAARFPSASNGAGFKALGEKIHAMGLKFGIHIMRGIPRNAVKVNLPIEGSKFHAADAANTTDNCPWLADMYGVRGDMPAGRAYYNSIFKLYASWGVDYIKMDDTSRPYHTAEIEAVDEAIQKCGRAIVYSLSPGETPIASAAHVASHANLWRVSDDFWDRWETLDHEFTLAERWKSSVGPGHWPDADMLPLGHLSVANRSVDPDRQTRFSRAEQVTLMSLWSLLPSPLMVGGNLPDNDPWTLALLTNPEVLAINQDVGGAAATLATRHDDLDIWTKPLADGSRAVGIFNRGDFDRDAAITPSDLHLSGEWAIRDLWKRADLGRLGGALTTSIPAHGAAMLRIRKQ
jgi:alpha-galactosidase